MTLVTPFVEPLAGAQGAGLETLARHGQAGPDLAGLVDALVNRFGQRSLYRERPQASAMPERAVAAAPALATANGAVWDDDLPRPCRMLRTPEKIDVIALLPDDAPRLFIWRGKRFLVTQGDGPERLHGEWWREGGIEAEKPYMVRDYYQVETVSGGRYWLFRLGDGETSATGSKLWFLHGAFA